ncbi:V-type ATP synthase subunit A [Oceanidesulfovibrio indonesiensis]|uniref:V-type ATP synthase alpha chain n=1 Tax=Oceanidesulfovibrio indonesiensis TaxID=54767 RepID=A0A7M3MAQ8_9BACT|nr:V-type ATP synthase subunit A [Oceanidesulfovibrio indonesiensis]
MPARRGGASQDGASTAEGRVVGVNGNLVTVEFEKPVTQNEVAYAGLETPEGKLELKAEVIRVRGRYADLQVFEDTVGLAAGDRVRFTGELLSVELGPGLLTRVYDGLQNPLEDMAEELGFFLGRGHYFKALDRSTRWDFTPKAEVGAWLRPGDTVGTVPESVFEHRIMVPFSFGVGEERSRYRLVEIKPNGSYTVDEVVAVVEDEHGERLDVTMVQTWPVKIPIRDYAERLKPSEPMVTKVRIIDSFFPVALGGTYCVPGPFGAGKTVIQQITSRHAAVDVVVLAACGERAGEVVETIRTFPELEDPRTGRSLMERTCIICNTSSMPVAAREASVYTAVTIAEYYRQMGLNVLLLADSTSRWAQALREMSGRLEEIPGEEAFPAYLESVIASFYERGGMLRLRDGSFGSVTIGGTVSPAGGNFEEPVTQSTLKVVGAFHGLSRERSDARRYPAIEPLESWSKYRSVVDEEQLRAARRVLEKGREVSQMMKVLGEEGTPIEDFIVYLKSEFLDAAYLQQDAFDKVDGATDAERQRRMFSCMARLLEYDYTFEAKDAARRFFQRLTQMYRDWNRIPMHDAEFLDMEKRLKEQAEEAAHV